MTAEEMKASGLMPEDFDDDVIEVWPENWQSFELFAVMGTQWRISMAGRAGLDYNALYPLLDRAGGDWQQLFDDVRAMESAALAEMQKK